MSILFIDNCNTNKLVNLDYTYKIICINTLQLYKNEKVDNLPINIKYICYDRIFVDELFIEEGENEQYFKLPFECKLIKISISLSFFKYNSNYNIYKIRLPYGCINHKYDNLYILEHYFIGKAELRRRNDYIYINFCCVIDNDTQISMTNIENRICGV